MRHSRNGTITKMVLSASLALLSSCGGGPLNLEQFGIQDPEKRFAIGTERNFANLINTVREGRPAVSAWAGGYYPYTSNGIAHGDGGPSPAGRYDAARGWCKKSDSAQAWEIRNHGAKSAPDVASWWGHCNGWSIASVFYPEPTENKVVNGVTFSPSDQKAILTEAAMLADYDMFGKLLDVNTPADKRDAYESDVLPNQFFLVLTNYMGRRKDPVLIDHYTGMEKWNQPLVGYRIDYPTPEDYLGADPQAPNVYRIKLTAQIWWTNEGSYASGRPTPPFEWEEIPGTYHTRVLKGEVWLDGPVTFGGADGKQIVSSGNVFMVKDEFGVMRGGSWYHPRWTTFAQPDYMWVPFQILNATDPSANPPDEKEANPYVDISWVESHILQGVDDSSATERCTPTSAPSPDHTGTGTGVSTGTRTVTSIFTNTRTGVSTATAP